ncbi:MAG: hypothetical protein OEM26_07925, partial [Saprospiraceae bacterium]|nr:hypothetical protein [Saprospiraceae bacterium]
MTKTLALAVLCLSALAYFPAESLGAELPPSCSPNCLDVNASIQVDQSDGTWFSRISWSEVLTNAHCALPVKYELRGPFGSPLQSGSSDDPGSEVYLVIEDPCSLLGKEVTLWISNGLGSSASNLTFKSGAPQFDSDRFFLRCDDRAVEDVQYYLDEFYGGYKPVYVPCEAGTVAATFVADWPIPFDCVPGSDTAKIILREFEATTKEGERRSAVDTVIVLRMPELTADNIYCAESDTVYCGFGSAGPYWLVPEIDPYSGVAGPDCDQIFLLSILSTGGSTNRSLLFRPRTFDSKCGVLVHVDQQRFNDACNPQYKVDIELKQNCFGSAEDVCIVEPSADGPSSPNAFESVGPGYWRCSFWITDFDTLAPVARCIYDLGPEDRLIQPSCSGEEEGHCYLTPATEGSTTCGETQPVIVVPSGTHDCGARVQLPAICVKDDWSGIKQVKVSIDGIGTWLMTDEGSCSEIAGGTRFELRDQVTLLTRADGRPHQVKYEVVDACHNTEVWYCYILVKDETKPVAVADKGVNVTLPGGSTVTTEGSKKVWVDAEVFDEGSWDNCGVNLLLARRTDWYTACIDLCDSVDWCCVGEHHDTIWQAKLNPDKTLDPVEAHYAKTLEWLSTDGGACTQLVYNAWLYDLLKWTTLQCRMSSGFTAQEFRKVFESCFLDYDLDCTLENVYNPASFTEADLDLSAKFLQTDLHPSLGCMIRGNATCGSELSESQIADLYQHIDVYEQIGGGWSNAVPFDCSDACGPVTVEILVMDYWCNWSKAWTDV